MKKARFIFLSLLTAIAFLSCLSTPPAKQEANAIPVASSMEPTPTSDGATPEATTAPADSATSPADTAATGDEIQPADIAKPETVASNEEGPAPVEEAETPEVPPSERLLYFYPEPDATLSVPPAKEAAPAEKPVAPKPAVSKPPVAAAAPSPAPKAPEKAKPAVAEKPKVKAAEKGKDTGSPDEASGAATAEILPGIWKSEPTAPTQAPEKASAVPAVPRQPPSRQATIPAGQTLEVWYPGSGWVFLGDASAQNGLGYENRKLDKADTLFTFKALKPGNYILDFSRFDVLDDSFMQDSLAVTVTDEAPIHTGRIRAPDYRAIAKSTGAATTVSPAQGDSAVTGGTAATTGSTNTAGTTSGPASVGRPGTVNSAGSAGATPQAGNANAGTTAATPSARGNFSQPLAGSGQALSPTRGSGSATMSDEPSVTSAPGGLAPQGNAAVDIPSDPDAILKKAQGALASGDAASALTLLDAFFTAAVSSLDEGLYLRGQAYESNGPSRDIRKALEAYQTLTQAYPDSPRWKSADERIRYIKQFYQKIR